MIVRETNAQKGFTMPELLVVGGVMTILIVLAVTLIHPADYGPQARNAERVTGTAQLAQAFNEYVRDNGILPEGIGSEAIMLGTEEGMLDLCVYLTPKYLKDLPLDPLGGSENEEVCHPSEASYITGYAVHTKDGVLTIEAPAAEDGEKIEIVRTYAPTVTSNVLEEE